MSEFYAELKEARKTLAICRSVFAIISVISSVTLIRMITTSKDRLSTTFHRLLLGMSIGDILFSLPMATFNAMAPSELNYMVWNAQGNQISCDVAGSVAWVGMSLTLLYCCSLNIYYLFKVKYNKTDSYIRTKIEPYLHGFPILISVLIMIHHLVRGNNNDSGNGDCMDSAVYQPPHCTGYEDGEVPEGFTIPCGRGRGGRMVWYICGVFLFLAPPLIISVSLGVLYVSVRKQETRISRFGAGSLDVSAQPNTNRDNSRAVLHKAIAYTTAYWLTWGLGLISEMMILAGIYPPQWYVYLLNIFGPLMGFFNLCIFIRPKVVAAKRRGQRGSNISWCQALGRVFWSGLVGGNSTRRRQPGNPVGRMLRTIPRIKLPFPRKGGNVENDTVAASSTLASTYRRESLANPGIVVITPTDAGIRRHLDLDPVQHSSTLGGGNGVITPTTEENLMDACIRRASLRLLDTNLDLDSVRHSSTLGGGNDVITPTTEENRMDACIRRASLRLLDTNLDLDAVRHSSTLGDGNDVITPTTEENRMDACIRRASLRLLETNLDLDSVRHSSTPGGGNGDVAEEKTESQVPVGP